MKDHQEEFEDTKGVIRIRKSKNRQHNGQKKVQKNKQRSTNIYRKLKIEQHEPYYKPGVNLGAPEGQAVPRPTSSTRRVNQYSLQLNHSKDKREGIKWSEKPIKALGVYFGNNKEECEKLNWETKIDKMNTLFFSWGKRNLTILGKIMIIKALVIPIFTFVASACVVPDKYRKEIESKWGLGQLLQ